LIAHPFTGAWYIGAGKFSHGNIV